MGRGHVSLATDQSALERGLAAAKQKFQAWGRGIAAAGTAMMGAGLAIEALLAPAIGVFATYEQSLADLRAAANPTAEQFAALRARIEQVSTTTGTSLPEVAAMFGELVKAGASVESVVNGMGLAAIQFARVSGMAMADTARILWGSMQIFSREGLTATQVMNNMARADGASATSLQMVA